MRVDAMLFKPLEVMLLVDEALGNGIRERLEVERLIHGNRVFILNPVHHVHKPNVIRGHAPAVGKIAHYLENGLTPSFGSTTGCMIGYAHGTSKPQITRWLKNM